jgi:hypothetical protein
MTPQIFISYSHADTDFANDLCQKIEGLGYEVWLDRTDIKTGSHWDDEIVKGLNASHLFLILLSNKSAASQNVKDEIGYALDHNMQILPVLLEVCDVPFRLKRYQYVDITTKKEGEKFEEILEHVRSLLAISKAEKSKPQKEKKNVDPITLATAATALLGPFIAKVGEGAAKKLGEQLPEKVGKLWNAISDRFKDKPAAAGAAAELASKPGDEDNKQAFELQLKKALKEDEEFANLIAELLEEAKSEAGISNVGDGAVATNHSNAIGKIQVGGNLSGNITVGNNNSVNSNKSND